MSTTKKVPRTKTPLGSLIIAKFASEEWPLEPLFDDPEYKEKPVNRYKNLLKYGYQKTPPITTMMDTVTYILRDDAKNVPRCKEILAILGKSRSELLGKLIPLDYLIVFGCLTSTDIDCAYCTFGDYNFNIDYPDMDLVRETLAGLGYDLSRDIDLTLVKIDEVGNVENSDKGTCHDTQNIIYYTWQNHQQSFDVLPITQPIPMSLDNLTILSRGVAKCFLDGLQWLVGTYRYKNETMEITYSDRKGEIYSAGGNTIVDGVMELYNEIHHWPLPEMISSKDSYKWQSTMKSLVMKLIQMMLLEKLESEFNKMELPQRFIEHIRSDEPEWENHLTWYLSRGNQGVYDPNHDALDWLMSQYERISKENVIIIDWTQLEFSIGNPTTFSNEFWNLFIETPVNPPITTIEQFMTETEGITPEGQISINQYFVEPCEGIELLRPEFVKRHVHDVSQRTAEWRDLLKFYRCGRNTGICSPPSDSTPTEIIRFYWNLIRGCIMEQFATMNVDLALIGLEEYRKVHVGLLVHEKVQGARGIAPDMLLVSPDGNEVVPVEIKCLAGIHADNSNYRREIGVATKQLRTSIDVLTMGGYVCDRGLLLFCYINQDVEQMIQCYGGFFS